MYIHTQVVSCHVEAPLLTHLSYLLKHVLYASVYVRIYICIICTVRMYSTSQLVSVQVEAALLTHSSHCTVLYPRNRYCRPRSLPKIYEFRNDSIREQKYFTQSRASTCGIPSQGILERKLDRPDRDRDRRPVTTSTALFLLSMLPAVCQQRRRSLQIFRTCVFELEISSQQASYSFRNSKAEAESHAG
jgi:hypothetical protein